MEQENKSWKDWDQFQFEMFQMKDHCNICGHYKLIETLHLNLINEPS